MKIEFVSEGSRDCPLIRVYGEDRQRIEQLMAAISHMIEDGNPIELHRKKGFCSVADCSLRFRVGDEDVGIARADKGLSFTWTLSRDGWAKVIGLLEPLALDSDGFQWLAGRESTFEEGTSEIGLVVSVSKKGHW